MNFVKRITLGLLTTLVVLCGCQDDGSGDTAVISVELSMTANGVDDCTVNTKPRNTSVTGTWCQPPHKPHNGHYEKQADVYSTGDTITYHCNRGHRLIGQAIRTCNGTSKQRSPREPYCEPEYVVNLLGRPKDIEDKVMVIEKRMTVDESNTSAIGCSVSGVEKRLSAVITQMNRVETQLSVPQVKRSSQWSATSLMDTVKERLAVCTNSSNSISQFTASKCMTMQLGLRNGQSVSEANLVVSDFKNNLPTSGYKIYDSVPFYRTVPGHKFSLRMTVLSEGRMMLNLLLIPGEYDDQVAWPFTTTFDVNQ